MAFALPLLVQLFDAIDGTVQWLGGTSSPAPQRERPRPAPLGQGDAHPAPARPSTPQRTPQRHWGGPTRSLSAQRPLRVVRAADRSPRACAGRMVISGRMADVCAELDRLAAQEMLH